MRKWTFLGSFALLVLLSGTLLADGFIVLPPVEGIRFEPLAVKYHRVKTTIRENLATTEIDQVFFNPNDRQLEGIYLFPIPEEASISKFSMYMDGKEVQGEMLDASQARRIYEDIVRKMRDPALLEYAGRDLFRARVFPIPARGEKRIKLSYSQVLKGDQGLYLYRYPLNTEKFSSAPLEEVSIDVEIESSVGLKNIYSPSHKVDVSQKDERSARVSFEERNVRPDRDFLLYYAFSEKTFGLNILTYKGGDEDGYFLLLLSPQVEVDPSRISPKDVVFVFDTSGSMRGEKLNQAKEALEFCIKGLNEKDRFALVPFATEAQPSQKGLVAASNENREKALEFVRKIEAVGGTNIDEALERALEMESSDSERSFTIAFLTDGQPTVGETDPAAILKDVKAKRTSETRLFVFGVGDDVNTHLLEALAEENRGLPTYVRPGENLELVISSFFEKLSQPVLENIDVDFGRVKTYDVYPRQLPDLFRGSQIVLLGRFEGSGSTAITLTGRASSKTERFTYDARFDGGPTEFDALPRIWATRKVGFLLSEIRLRGEREELKDEIVRLAKRFGIMTPYTSFLVLEDAQRRGGDVLVDRRYYDEHALSLAREATAAPTGAGSVKAGKEIGGYRLAQQDVAASESELPRTPKGENAIRHMAEKTFFLKEGVWIDSTYKAGTRTIRLKYLSDDYFELLGRHPEIGKFLALGERVIVVFDGKAYEIEAE